MRPSGAKFAALFTIAIGLLVSQVAFGQTFLRGFPNKKPKQILNDQKDCFFLDYGSSICVFSDKIDHIVKPRDPNSKYGSYGFDNVVSSQGTIYSIFKSSYTPKDSKTTHYHLYIAKCSNKKCRYSRLASWSYTSGSKSYTSYSASPLRISKKDGVFFTVIYCYSSKKYRKSKTYYYFNRRKTSRERYHQLLSQHFPPPRSGIELTGEVSFEVNGKEEKYHVDRSSRYTRTVIWGQDEVPHIFFHDPSDRSFYHRFYSQDRKAVIETHVDTAESGMENVAFLTNREIWSIHYFYRDAFHKGLLVTVQAYNGQVIRQFVLDASETRNSGWDLVGGKSSSGRVLFTYLSDKDKNQREFVLLRKIQELEVLGNNLARYGHPKGDGHLEEFPLEEREKLIQELASAHLIKRRDFQLNLGTGIQHVTWSVDVGKPGEESGVQEPFEPEYQLSDSFMNIFSLEGKYGGTNFGIELISKLIDEEVEHAGSKELKQLNRWKGQLGWERLFFNFDVRIQMEDSTTTVFFEDKSNQAARRKFDMDFQEIKLSLLTLKRHHFGLLRQTYNFYQPVYIYVAPAGSTSWESHSQAIGEIQATNWALHYGYSTLDYLVKYETDISNWFFDGEIRGGVSFADFNGDLQMTGNKRPKTEWTWLLGAQVEAGWIWYRRWKRLKQMGVAIKLSYRADYSGIGSSDKPKDKEEASDTDEYYFRFERTELRHGPVLFITLNF